MNKGRGKKREKTISIYIDIYIKDYLNIFFEIHL